MYHYAVEVNYNSTIRIVDVILRSVSEKLSVIVNVINYEYSLEMKNYSLPILQFV